MTAPSRLPALFLFLGHGNSMNALASNPYTEAWTRIGADVPRPAAVLAISAHWFVPGTRVTARPLRRRDAATPSGRCRHVGRRERERQPVRRVADRRARPR